jgi:hypothetical protein
MTGEGQELRADNTAFGDKHASGSDKCLKIRRSSPLPDAQATAIAVPRGRGHNRARFESCSSPTQISIGSDENR